MRKRTLSGALLLLAVLGCEPAGSTAKGGSSAAPSASVAAQEPDGGAGGKSAASSGSRAHQGSAIVLAESGDALFVADEDHSLVHGVPLPAEVKAPHVEWKAPGRPVQIVATKDRLLVTVRQIGTGEGALLVLKRKGALELEEVGRVNLPVDAWGVTTTPDEGVALVTSAWTHQLSAVDLKTLKVLWSVDVAREPRGIAVLPAGDRAYVSHLVGSGVTRIDGLGAQAPTVKRVELPASPLRAPYGTKLSASLGYSVVASPTGDRVFFPRHALGALGPDAWFGAGTVDVLLTEKDTPAAPARNARPLAHFVQFVEAGMPQQKWIDGAGPVIDRVPSLMEPRAAVYRKSTNTLLIAEEGGDHVTMVDALAMDPTLVMTGSFKTARKENPPLRIAEIGGAPTGIALSADENEAYVFCRATLDVIVLKLSRGEGGRRIVPPLSIPLTKPEEDKAVALGRQLYLNSTEGVVSGGVSCAGCHPDGRDDGHTWHEVPFKEREESFKNFFGGTDLSAIRARWDNIDVEAGADGPGALGYARQTPMLAGRVKAAGPYGWHGESADLSARLKAGFGLHRWRTGDTNAALTPTFIQYLAAYARDGLVPPPRVERALTDEESKGKAIFESPTAQCSTCHVPATGYTDRIAVPLKAIRPPAGFVEDPNPQFKTPSLLYVGGSAPYMHDGRYETLESLIEYNQDRMGKTAQLSADERKALIAFLRTL